MLKRRLDTGLSREDLGELMGVRPETVRAWESDRCVPRVERWPQLLEFLGYDPHGKAFTLAEKLDVICRQHGWKRYELAQQLHVSESTVTRWSAGQMPWEGQCRSAVRQLLEDHDLTHEWWSPSDDERDPGTVGEHLRRRRLALGLMQLELAAEFGAGKSTLQRWEWNQREPAFRHWPAIIAFLGYDPSPGPQTEAQWLVAIRRRRGWSQRTLARKIEVNWHIIQDWEAGRESRCSDSTTVVERLLAAGDLAPDDP